MQILLAFIPIAAFAILWAILRQLTGDWRNSFMGAALLWTCYLVMVTEGLGAFRLLTFGAVLLSWLAAITAEVVIARRVLTNPLALWEDLRSFQPSKFDRWLLGACGVIAGITALISLISPPNSWDSLAYHLPRIMHWIQDRSVAFYPTNILRQLYLVPGAEYIMLHLQLLAGSDLLDALVQWFSMLGCATAASRIAAQMGGGRRVQIYTAAIVMTIPVGILEASGTQTDYVISFWLACFVSWMLSLRERWDKWSLVAAGASLGLAALTKATTYIFALPFLAWFGWSLLRKYRLQALGLGAAALVFLIINLPSYIRSQQLFGNPVGITIDGTVKPPVTSYKLANDMFTPAVLISNVTRNIGWELSTPIPAVNDFIFNEIEEIHQAIHLPISDARTTWPGRGFRVVPPLLSEVTDGNLLHTILAGLCVLTILAHPVRNRDWTVSTLCLVAGFLIFCLYLRWQSFGSRLQLPLFVLGAPIAAHVMEESRPSWIGKGTLIVLLLAAVPWLLMNNIRPLVGYRSIVGVPRTQLYFRPHPPVAASYNRAVAFLSGGSSRACSQFGFYSDTNDFEYPFWVMLQEATGAPIMMEAVGVRNVSIRTEAAEPSFTPCAILAVNPPPPNGFEIWGQSYKQAWTSEYVSVFLPARVP